jgi:hypothetical protein
VNNEVRGKQHMKSKSKQRRNEDTNKEGMQEGAKE